MALNISGKTAVTFLNRAFHNTALGNELFNYQVAEAGSTDESQLAFAAKFGQSFSDLSNAEFANLVLTNMGVLPSTVDSVLAFQTELVAYLDGVALGDRGIVVLQLADILADLQDPTGELAVYAAAATGWDREVAISLAYSDNAANHITKDPVDNLDEGAPHLLGITAGVTTVTLNFDEVLKDVAPSILTPLFTVTSKDAITGVVSTYPVGVATIDGSSVTLGLTATLGTDVKVTYTGTALTDAAGNAVAAIPATVASTDTTAPTWTVTSPVDAAVGVAANANLTLTFADLDNDTNAATVTGIKLSTGTIKLVNTTEAADSRTFDVTDASQVTFNTTDKTLVINPTVDLKAGATYEVQVDRTIVRDLNGNALEAIGTGSGADEKFTFTVTDNKGQTATVTPTANTPIVIGGDATKDNAVLVNEDFAAAGTTAQKNTGADTVILATKPAENATVTINNFTVGAGTDADTLKLGGYSGLSALIADIKSITVTESASGFNDSFNVVSPADPTFAFHKQFLDFTVQLKNGASISLPDLIAFDALAPAARALLVDTVETNAGSAADFLDQNTAGTDGLATETFTGAAVTTLVGTLAGNLEFFA